MRQLNVNVILATLIIATVQVDAVHACKFLNRSMGRCCVRRCCPPVACLPTVCGPASDMNAPLVEAEGQAVAEPAAEAPAAPAPEAPAASPVQETTPATEAPAEEAAAMPEETAPTEEQAPAAPVAAEAAEKPAPEPEPAQAAEKPAGGGEAMGDKESLDSFFGEDKEKPAGAETPAPAAEPEAPKSDSEAPAQGGEKSALDDFFSMNSGFRTWRDISGRYELEAKFVEVFDDGSVRLEKPNGRWVRVQVSQLSPSDQLVAHQLSGAVKMIAMNAR